MGYEQIKLNGPVDIAHAIFHAKAEKASPATIKKLEDALAKSKPTEKDAKRIARLVGRSVIAVPVEGDK